MMSTYLINSKKTNNKKSKSRFKEDLTKFEEIFKIPEKFTWKKNCISKYSMEWRFFGSEIEEERVLKTSFTSPKILSLEMDTYYSTSKLMF